MNETTEVPNPANMPFDPDQAQQGKEASKSDVFGTVVDAVDFGGLAIDAAVLAVQAGGVAIEAGAATLKAVAAGTEAVGSLVAGIFDGV